ESAILKKNKAQFDFDLAAHQLASLTLRAPADGMVTLAPNYRAAGIFGGSSAPEFKPGDRAWAGAMIAELPNLSSIRVLAHVDEIDRGKLQLNQRALVRVDAVPDREFNATIAEISAIGKPDFSTWPPPKNFDVVLQISDSDPRLRPGMSANARIIVNSVKNGLTIPAQAVFEKNGKTVVYIVRGADTQERSVTVLKRSGADALIGTGLEAGERVA